MGEGMTKGTRIHFVRPQEKGCRPGTLVADSFEEHVTFPKRGLFNFGHLTYGDHAGSDTKHTFECVRAHDPIGTVDTWHVAKDCPFIERPAMKSPSKEAPPTERPPRTE